nr:hypothetical protein [uncultured Cohaesibacter sp.]
MATNIGSTSSDAAGFSGANLIPVGVEHAASNKHKTPIATLRLPSHEMGKLPERVLKRKTIKTSEPDLSQIAINTILSWDAGLLLISFSKNSKANCRSQIDI